jgi:hypothetical protein
VHEGSTICRKSWPHTAYQTQAQMIMTTKIIIARSSRNILKSSFGLTIRSNDSYDKTGPCGLRTENPADSAASANRWSPQMKLLLDGRCSHQIMDEANWRLSAARKEYLSNDCVANSRTWSPGRISLHPRLSNRRRASAPCLSKSVIS